LRTAAVAAVPTTGPAAGTTAPAVARGRRVGSIVPGARVRDLVRGHRGARGGAPAGRRAGLVPALAPAVPPVGLRSGRGRAHASPDLGLASQAPEQALAGLFEHLELRVLRVDPELVE